MGDSNNTHNITDYLAQLIKDKKQLEAFPTVFIHVGRLLDEEINKVRANLFHISGPSKDPLVLPDAQGPTVTLQDKIFVPTKEHPDFNFVGRILGPRGMTAKQLEQETGCKIMVRGKGSMRDKKKEEQNRGKPNWEHLSEELHILITVEDTENRAKMKMTRAADEIRKLLVPSADGEDELKKRQLMELAIINGTYRDSSTRTGEVRMLAPGITLPLRTTTPLGGPPIIMSSRLAVPTSTALLNGSPGSGAPGIPPLIAPDATQLLYTTNPYADFASSYHAITHPLLTELPADLNADVLTYSQTSSTTYKAFAFKKGFYQVDQHRG